jgi:hypothetical protein
MNRQAVMEYIAARAKEPSTWRGLIAMLTAAGVYIKPEAVEVIVTVGLGLGGLVGVAFADSRPKPPEFADTQPLERK